MTSDEKELVKIGADATVKPFGDLLQRLFGPAADTIGEMWAESLMVRRLKRQIKLFEKVQEILVEAGFEPQPIPDRLSVPLLNGATLNDSEVLQRRWAALIANAAHPKNRVHPGFVQILENMGALDALVLDEMYKRLLADFRQKGNFQIVYLDSSAVNDVLRVVKENGGETALDNLVRLRLFLPETENPNPFKTSEGLTMRPTFRYYLTRLGLEFYLACQPPAVRDKLIRECPPVAGWVDYPTAPPY